MRFSSTRTVKQWPSWSFRPCGASRIWGIDHWIRTGISIQYWTVSQWRDLIGPTGALPGAKKTKRTGIEGLGEDLGWWRRISMWLPSLDLKGQAAWEKVFQIDLQQEGKGSFLATVVWFWWISILFIVIEMRDSNTVCNGYSLDSTIRYDIDVQTGCAHGIFPSIPWVIVDCRIHLPSHLMSIPPNIVSHSYQLASVLCLLVWTSISAVCFSPLFYPLTNSQSQFKTVSQGMNGETWCRLWLIKVENPPSHLDVVRLITNSSTAQHT